MGVTIPKGATFLGVPLIKIRNLLKGWRHGDREDLWRLAVRKDIDLDPRTVMVLMEELWDRGLVGLEAQEDGPAEDGLTEAGLGLSGAIARKRTSKPQAQAILDRFLSACATVNETPDLPFEIRQIWLFGSMLDPGSEDVGDIDLVVEQGRPAGFETWKDALSRFEQLGKEMGAPRQSGLMSIMGDQDFVERRLLHGGQRHPLLSKNSLDELTGMGCACQLIFDASRGGRVLPKNTLHPMVREDVWGLFHRGKYDAAVFEAMKAVEIAVREAANLQPTDVGTALMRKAFDPQGGALTDRKAPVAEREARSALFAGAMGSYKNPQSHRKVDIDSPDEAAEIIMLACHLLRIVTERNSVFS